MLVDFFYFCYNIRVELDGSFHSKRRSSKERLLLLYRVLKSVGVDSFVIQSFIGTNEGAAPPKPCEVVFQSPQAVGVGPMLFGL